MNASNLEILKKLEKRRDSLQDELKIIAYSTIINKDMPVAAKEVRVIQVKAIEYGIEALRQRILELIYLQKL